MSYKFIKTMDETNEHDTHNVEFFLPDNDVNISVVVNAFEEFLKAVGFHEETVKNAMEEQT